MPAYAKMSLVTAVFHPSDIAFARAWSAVAPGYGGWGLRLDREDAPEQVAVVPPGARQPVFFITRHGREVVLRQPDADDEPRELARYDGLRLALLALCPLDEAALEQINETLEQAFPRRDRR